MPAEILLAVFTKTVHSLGQGKWIEHIVLHPGAQGNMPAVPEVRDGTGEIRTFEILVQGNAEAFSRPHHHVHAAGKVTVQLDGIAQDPHNDRNSCIGFIIAKHLIHHNRGPVRYDDFLKISPKHQLQAPFNTFQAEFPLAEQLGCQPVITPDWPLQDLRKK